MRKSVRRMGGCTALKFEQARVYARPCRVDSFGCKQCLLPVCPLTVHAAVRSMVCKFAGAGALRLS